MIKIAFAGPSGTGKTTLATHLAETLGIPLNPVGARSVSAAMGFKTPYEVDTVPGARAAFQRKLIADKLAWENAHESFVTDRTPLDNITYTVMHDHKAIDAELLASASAGTRCYTHVIQCTMATFFHPGDDAARVKDATYHELYECVLNGLLDRHVPGVRVHPLVGMSLLARKQEVSLIVGGA